MTRPARRVRGRCRGAVAPSAERLEPRHLLSTRTWTSPTGGTWQSAANWSGGIVPGAGDLASFTLADSGTIRFNGNPAVSSISVAEPTFTSSAGVTLNMTATNVNVGGAVNVGVN